MSNVKQQFEDVVNVTRNGVVDDWEIMDRLDDDAAEEWGVMCSDGGGKAEYLAKANAFLVKYNIAYTAIDVDTESYDDMFAWTFLANVG